MAEENFLKGEGDRYLIDNVKKGDQAAFRQLVDRFSGRLKAYASRRLHGTGLDAEDAVQETFLGLVQSIQRIDRVRSLQAYLFQILRNKIVDLTGKRPEAHGLHRIPLATEDSQGETRGFDPISPEKTPSSYVRRDENVELRNQILADILEKVINRLKEEKNFRDLKILELLFYSSWINRNIATEVGVSEPTITRVKASTLETLSRLVHKHPLSKGAKDLMESDVDSTGIIRKTWQENLLSCLKRSSLGAYALNTLEGEWLDYIAFHLKTAACETCQANLEDLQSESPMMSEPVRERIFASSVGFLKKP